MTKSLQPTLPTEIIERKIYLVRGHKVMLDSDLAELYGVEVRALNQAVKRNLTRFPKISILKITNCELKDGQGTAPKIPALCVH